MRPADLPPRRPPHTPAVITAAVTSRCNQRCAYCCVRESATERVQELSTAEWLALFDEAGRISVLRVRLVGGEPTLRPDLPALIQGIVRNRMRFSMQTNGTLIDDDMAAFLAGTGRCDSVHVSLDGHRPELHDALRGEGTFDRAVRGVRVLAAHGVPVSAMVTLHRGNCRELPRILSFALDDLGVRAVSVEILRALGACPGGPVTPVPDAEGLSRAMEALYGLMAQRGPAILAGTGLPGLMRRWLSLRDGRPPAPVGRDPGLVHREAPGRLGVCGTRFSALTVRSDGVYIPCMFLGHIELGRVGRDPLEEVWSSHPELERLRRREGIPLTEFEGCRGCAYVGACTGGCPALAHAATGSDEVPDPATCLRRFLEAGGRLPAGAAWV